MCISYIRSYDIYVRYLFAFFLMRVFTFDVVLNWLRPLDINNLAYSYCSSWELLGNVRICAIKVCLIYDTLSVLIKYSEKIVFQERVG